MKFFVILIAVSMLGACASAPKQKDKSSPKITVTGTRIDRSELPPGPRVSMKVNQENEDSDFLKVFAEMEGLPKPKDIGDCRGLLSALGALKLPMNILDENNVLLKTDYGIYTYTFDDNSCPVNET